MGQLQSIAVTPANGSAARGLTQQFKAVGTYTDGGTKDISALVSWSTSNIAVATINAQGLASTPGTGTATVTAADPSSSIQGSTTFTVTAAQVASLAITPATATVPLGDTQQYTATAILTDGTTQNVTTSVNWSTSTTTVPIARVSTSGLATTYAVGQSGVGATMPYGAGHANAVLNVTAAQLATIAVAPTNASVAAGLTQQLTAQGTYTDGNTHDLAQQVTWSSQNPAIATVDATTGVVTAIAPGTAALVATSNSNQSIQGTRAPSEKPRAMQSREYVSSSFCAQDSPGTMVATNLPNYKGQLTNKLRLLPRFPRVVNERLALIWSDHVNAAKSVGMFFVVALVFSRGQSEQQPEQVERRLISLIFAGRNRIIMIRRELPLTVNASPAEPVA
ncbi:MAG: trimeric autotransporter adhesin [Acidobacteriaceae bacterium]|nr:trimeric autotransporter adhesin [Acidobacteriaceae bacterium]